MSEDFSLKWFGIPDKQVVAFWKLIGDSPRLSKEGMERRREDNRRIARIYEAAARGDCAAQSWVAQDHFNRCLTRSCRTNG